MSKPSKPKVIKLPKILEEDLPCLVKESENPRIINTDSSEADKEIKPYVGIHRTFTNSTFPKNWADIQKLHFMLNDPETKCSFWFSHDMKGFSGIRPVKRTTVETLNKDGFNPWEKKVEETFFRFYIIDVLEEKHEGPEDKETIEKRIRLEDLGYIYLRSHNIDWIYNYIKSNK